MNFVAVHPAILRWAKKRSGQSTQYLYKKFPKLKSWEEGKIKPTLKQLEKFTKAVHIPIGYLFLDKPPIEKTPIPDFRKMPNTKQKKPSPNLLDTLYICQQRQNWYKNYLHSMREQPLDFIGSVQPLSNNIIKTAECIRKILHFKIEERQSLSTWTSTLNQLIEQANSAGILVMVNGIVGNNTNRKLNPEEFRGFALSDSLAPLIFINGADTKAAQMFTIAHELAHLWIDKTGLSNAQALSISNHQIESWCNKVAAELLVPFNIISQQFNNKKIQSDFNNEVQRLAKYFKVSSLVILRRLYDIKKLEAKKFNKLYNKELTKLRTIQKSKQSSGGDFFLTLEARANPHFMKALVSHTLEGYTPFRESFQLLGIKKMATFKKIGKNFGINC